MNVESEKFLEEEEIKQKVESYRGRLPSVVLDDILENLKGKRVTEDQLERILEKAATRFKGISGRKLDEVYDKINSLERLIAKTLANLPRMESESENDGKSDPETGGLEISAPELADETTPSKRKDASIGLHKVPETPRETILLLKWLEFLLSKAGYDGLEEVLGYYVDIGWISEDVMFRMIKYARGIKMPQIPEREDGLMTTQDHIISLLFIEALKNGGLREEDLFAVEREVQKIKREASQIYGV